ncbi:hypothetical protein KAJ27_03350 [bacterium]|nr:hypothetical protein [bacterium]
MNKCNRNCYHFAHEALRNFCADDPKKFFKNLFSDTSEEYILLVWNLVYSRVCSDADIDINEFKVMTTEIDNCPTVLIKMSEFVNAVHAHYVAILLTDNADNSVNDGGIKYYSLDYGETYNGSCGTVLSEWHKNYHFDFIGSPVVDGKQFLKVIRERFLRSKMN